MRTMQKTVEYKDDIELITKGILCCHKANSFTTVVGHNTNIMKTPFLTSLTSFFFEIKVYK